MADPHRLQRFLDAQEGIFNDALSEIRAGRKRTHWMWFIFPQLLGLGRSPMAQFYAIKSLDEAREYLAHPMLGSRLRETIEALLPWAGQGSAEDIFGPVDAMKMRSCLTLFEAASGGPLFGRALDGFFSGERDERTLALLRGAR